ncbi:MAG: hypothetical protein JOZ83_05320 [Silvibacterium sp.]|nr:hypothetical protein [Silvibacterium sp.]
MREAQRKIQAEYELHSDRRVLLIKANLDIGWKNLGSFWGFDEQDRLPFEKESTFVCRLRLRHGKELAVPKECLEIYPGVQSSEKIDFDTFSLERDLQSLKLRIPIADQKWVPTNNLSRHPLIYLAEEGVFRTEIEEFTITYDFYAWIRLHGPTKMFVPDKFEWGDGFAWVGGRPESNRKRF